MNKQRWIAFDQWVHTLFYADAMADETYSARCWREYALKGTAHWHRRVKIIDWLALKLFEDADHCKTSYEAEQNREHLPEGYDVLR